MAFSKDDKDYLSLLIKPLATSIAELNKKMEAHDDKTTDIENIQNQMIGAIKILGIAVLPIFCSVATWWFTKG